MFCADFVPIQKRQSIYDETSNLIIEKGRTILRFQELAKWFGKQGFTVGENPCQASAISKDIITAERVQMAFLKISKLKDRFLITKPDEEVSGKIKETFEKTFSLLWYDLLQINRQVSMEAGFIKHNIELKKRLSLYNHYLDKFFSYVSQFIRLFSMSYS